MGTYKLISEGYDLDTGLLYHQWQKPDGTILIQYWTYDERHGAQSWTTETPVKNKEENK